MAGKTPLAAPIYAGKKAIMVLFRVRSLVHVVLPLSLSLCAVIGGLYRVHVFLVHDYDYGIYSNLLWNFAHGNGWLMSLYEGQARGANFLAEHLALLVPFLSPLFSFFPSPYTFSVLHGLAFSAVYFLAPLLVREIWREAGREDYERAAIILLLVLAVFKGFNGAWRFQSHFTTLVMPFLLLALIGLHRRKLLLTLACAFVITLAQERASLAVFGLGLYAIGVTRNFRLGLSLCFFSAAYFFFAVKLLIPFFAGGGDYLHAVRIKPFADIASKIWFLLCCSLYWLLLPLCGKKAACAAFCALPLLSLGLVSNMEGLYNFDYHYQDLPSLFFLASAAHGLLWLTDKSWFARLPRFVPPAAVALGIVACASTGLVNVPPLVVLGMKQEPVIERLNEKIGRYQEMPEQIAAFATNGIGPRFSLRKRHHNITPERAGQNFHASMVFVAPGLSTYPYDDISPVLQALDANPSLTRIENSDELRVYRSTDLDGNKD